MPIDAKDKIGGGRGLPLDETLVYVAADLIYEAYIAENKEKNRDHPPTRHRVNEFPFTILELEEGLTGHRFVWSPNHDAQMVREGKPNRMNSPQIIDSFNNCVCPDWMDCYCGKRTTPPE